MIRRRYTGHPSPAHQVARRVGISAAGYTEGVATPEGPRLFHGRVPVRRETVPEPEKRAATIGPRSAALLALLGRLGSDLPSLGELGNAIGLHTPDYGLAAHVSAILGALERRGDIVWWRGHPHGHRGQHAIRIVSTGQVLRSAKCPEGVEP